MERQGCHPTTATPRHDLHPMPAATPGHPAPDVSNSWRCLPSAARQERHFSVCQSLLDGLPCALVPCPQQLLSDLFRIRLRALIMRYPHMNHAEPRTWRPQAPLPRGPVPPVGSAPLVGYCLQILPIHRPQYRRSPHPIGAVRSRKPHSKRVAMAFRVIGGITPADQTSRKTSITTYPSLTRATPGSGLVSSRGASLGS